ncbi:50S ribosomal protein L23 [bacterium]|nr:50S ribosomal protein L23 [bacterium]
MELTRFDVIKRPLITTKTVELYKELGQYTFEVHLDANKSMVRDAVEKLWNVKVEKVRIIKLHGKNKAFNRRPYKGSDLKKAIITLAQGHKIEIPGLFETMTAQQPQEQEVAGGN